MKNSIIVKTIIFISVVGLMALLFFGLKNSSVTEMEAVGFGFRVFSVFLIYVASIVSNLVKINNIEPSDLVSLAIVYAIPTFVLSELGINEALSMKQFIIYDIALFVVCIIIFSSLLLRKDKNN